MALFEGYERKIDKINGVLAQYGLESVEACRELCQAAGFDPYEIVKGIQPIAFEDAAWSYCVGAAIALKKGVKNAAEAAEAIGIGLQAFCIPGSVAEDRKVGLGHGNLGAMLLRDETKCFAFLAGHESFAAAEGAIGIARSANKARKEPLRVILNGLLHLPSGRDGREQGGSGSWGSPSRAAGSTRKAARPPTSRRQNSNEMFPVLTQGRNYWARRRPWMLNVLDGVSPPRFATRQYVALPDQPPPRFTREEAEDGPLGLFATLSE